MNSAIAGVRQNLKLLVDHGQVAANASSDVMSNWGATLGGGAYVWRSGLGITKDGRIVYVYGSALNAQDLGELLQRAGAVEGMQMDINPAWMKFDYYQAKGNPKDPTAGAAAADAASAPRTLLLHPVDPRLHRGLRAVTINKTAAPGEDTGPRAYPGARFRGGARLARALAAGRHRMTTRPRRWPKNACWCSRRRSPGPRLPPRRCAGQGGCRLFREMVWARSCTSPDNLQMP